VRKLSGKAVHDFERGSYAHDFYTLLYPGVSARLCGEDWRRGPSVCM
jgi:hypothetical protein